MMQIVSGVGRERTLKHACYHCPQALDLYKTIFQLLNLNPRLTITNMVLSHERPHYVGGERVNEEYLAIVDLVSTMTLAHILQSRSAKKGLERHILFLDIKNVLCKIREKYSKYKPIIDAILAGEYDPG